MSASCLLCTVHTIYCNNNNMDQELAANISPLGQVTANDPMPAIKFLGVFFIQL